MIIESDRSPDLEVTLHAYANEKLTDLTFYQVKVIAETKTAIDHAKEVAFGPSFKVLHLYTYSYI